MADMADGGGTPAPPDAATVVTGALRDVFGQKSQLVVDMTKAMYFAKFAKVIVAVAQARGVSVRTLLEEFGDPRWYFCAPDRRALGGRVVDLPGMLLPSRIEVWLARTARNPWQR